jgi:hypothetical protein
MQFNIPKEWFIARAGQEEGAIEAGNPAVFRVFIDRKCWVAQVAQELAKRHGDAEPNERLKDWAEALAENYFDDPEDRISPVEAVDEEFSNA